MIEGESQKILSIQMGELKMGDALQDVVLTADAKNTIRALYGECQSKTGQAQIDCFNKATDQAQVIIDQYEKGWGKGTLNGLRRWFDSVIKIREDLKKKAGEPEAVANADPFVLLHAGIIATTDTAQQAAARQTLKGWQWAFANLIEASLLLTALTGPVAIAGSLLPIGTRPIWAWLTGMFSLGMAKIYLECCDSVREKLKSIWSGMFRGEEWEKVQTSSGSFRRNPDHATADSRPCPDC